MTLKTENQNKTNQTKNWSFEKYNKMDKSVVRLPKKKEERHKLLLEMKERTSLQILQTLNAY